MIKNIKTKQIEEKTCANCGGSKTVDSYFTSRSFMHSDGKCHVCKECVNELVGTDMDKILMFLSSIDTPFLQNAWDTKSGDLGKYLSQMQMRQNKSKTFRDSDKQVSFNPIVSREHEEVEEFIVSKEDKMTWRGVEDENIEYMKFKYNELIQSGYKDNTPIKKMLLQNIVKTQFQLDGSKNTDEQNKLYTMLGKMMNDANVKPSQETSLDEVPYGVWIKKVEDEEPIAEVDEEFKDVDGIANYIYKWFTGHLKK